MKARTSMLGIILSTLIYSCGVGDVADTSEQGSIGEGGGVKMTALQGSAQFGSQCPAYGYSTSPHEVPTELWDCPVEMPKVELSENLQPFMLQADCKKMTIDVRNPSQTSLKASTWDMMPDGNFFFTVDGGLAKLKDDGAGRHNCATPLVAKLWGKVDCKTPDNPTIAVETVWWFGTALEADPTVTTGGTGNGSRHRLRFEPILPIHILATPVAAPISSPVASAVPSSIPSVMPSPEPEPVPSALPSAVPSLPTDPVTPSAPACHVPSSCYFHAITRIHQCS